MIPEIKADRRIQFTYEFLQKNAWNYFGARKGQCPNCNLFKPSKET